MVGTGQIKLGKLIMRPDGDFTWHNCSLDSLLCSTFLCNFTHTIKYFSERVLPYLLMGFCLVPYDHGDDHDHQCS